MENPQKILQLLNGSKEGRRFVITEFPCVLGRGERCSSILHDPLDPPSLSREHCTLTWENGQIVVTDHSTNGTVVGDSFLKRGQRAILASNTVLQLGPVLQILYLETPGGDVLPLSHPAAAPIFVPGSVRQQLTSDAVLQEAWRRVYLNRGAAGPDNITVQEFAQNAAQRLALLAESLQSSRYEPLPPRYFAAPKRSGGVRTLSILSIQDRVVQQALHAVLMPYIEPILPPCSFAYRPGVGAHVALRRLDSLLRQGKHWIAETDIAAFFDAISHRILLEQLGALFPDPFLLSLVARCLAVCAVTPGTGVPQGAATSPLFSNLFLAEFDRFLLSEGANPIRFADDLVLACETRGEAQTALAKAEGFLRSQLQLTLKAEKTGVVTLQEGFQFLGFAFSEAGRQPSPAVIIRKAELLHNAEPHEIAAKTRGWENYYGKQELPAQTPAAKQDDEESMLRFLRLFVGREDCFARQSKAVGKRTFVPCTGAITPDLVRQHWAGTEAIATYLLRHDTTVRQMVLDIDAVRPVGRPSQEPLSAETLQAAWEAARDMRWVCHEFGIPCALVDSGQKGRHLWILFADPVETEQARRLGRLLAKHAGFPREGVRLEILPRQTQWAGLELGDAITLPLGVHPVTGRARMFLDREGEPIPNAAEAILSLPTVSAADLERLLAQLSQKHVAAAKDWVEQSEEPAVQALVSGCSVIRAILRKAAETGHLRHTHQLILLYTAGHLGEAGQRFIHQTISLCRNYDEAICQKYLDRLEPNHTPISCRRIREWLEEEGETGWCTCAAGKKSPLESVIEMEGEKRPRKKPSTWAKPESSLVNADDWHAISAEIFEDDDADKQGG